MVYSTVFRNCILSARLQLQRLTAVGTALFGLCQQAGGRTHPSRLAGPGPAGAASRTPRGSAAGSAGGRAAGPRPALRERGAPAAQTRSAAGGHHRAQAPSGPSRPALRDRPETPRVRLPLTGSRARPALPAAGGALPAHRTHREDAPLAEPAANPAHDRPRNLHRWRTAAAADSSPGRLTGGQRSPAQERVRRRSPPW